MEKENRKAREDARKEYNDTVRVGYSLSDLVANFLPFSSLL
jgi:hypothetical protein